VARVDRLERLTDLVLVLLNTKRPLTLRELGDAVPGYPPEGEARRQAFERDKRTLRDQGIAVVAEPIEGPEQMGYRILVAGMLCGVWEYRRRRYSRRWPRCPPSRHFQLCSTPSGRARA
jgi:predicted DNA-binding transcriptional regulator YafY